MIVFADIDEAPKLPLAIFSFFNKTTLLESKFQKLKKKLYQ